jgi:hypothetical protein
VALLLPAVFLALTACGSGAEETDGGVGSASSTGAVTPTPEPTVESDAREVAAQTPRIAYTYDGGIQVRDATTLELVADIPLAGFNRLNPAGDGRDLIVSTQGGFQVLDLGVWQTGHGDHFHYYTAQPSLTDQIFPAQTPGHVVSHDGWTALFDDATGQVTIFESAEAQDPDRELRQYTAPAAHHGVAVLVDGTLVVSQGAAEGRTGAQALDVDDAVLASSSDCPGLHGAGVAADEAVVLGCADGALVYRDGVFTKLTAPAEAGGISGIAATEDSPIALGDYAVEGAVQDKVALIDTAAGTIRLVQLPSAYYGFNDFTVVDGAIGAVLGLDGQLHLIDLAAGAVTGSYPVIGAWEAPENWQAAAPKVLLLEGMLYITDPATRQIHVVDPATGKIWKSVALDVVPLELAGAAGDAEAEHDHEEDHAEDHDHDEEGEEP